MEQGMTRDRWLSLGLKTVEAADSRIVGIPRHGADHHLLGTAAS